MMNINRKELRKISHDFRLMASRMINAHYQECAAVLTKFLNFIDSTPLIQEYILSLPVELENPIEEDVEAVSNGHGRVIFSTGATPDEEVVYIYQLLQYVKRNPDNILAIGYAYCHSKHLSDMAKSFGNRIILPFTNNIELYLRHLGIDMGIDESEHYVITVNGGQVNLAKDNSIINAVQNNSINTAELDRLVQSVKILSAQANLSTDRFEAINDNIDVLQEELKKNEPKKGFIKTAICGLQNACLGLKDTVELSAAVTSLIQFAMTVL